MENLNIQYSSLQTLYGKTPIYYISKPDGSFVLYAVSDDFFIVCNCTESADITDFTTNHQSACTAVYASDDAKILGYQTNSNALVAPKAKDGRPITKTSTANRTNNFKLRAFCFYTSTGQSGVHNINPVTKSDYGDVTVTMYDNMGAVTTTAADSVMEYIDFMPHYNYEIIGGKADVPQDLLGGATDQWFISGIGVPDLPGYAGGSIDYISEINIEAVTPGRGVSSDGRSVSYLPYNYGGYPTNKLRFIIKHPQGVAKRFQIYIEHFV